MEFSENSPDLAQPPFPLEAALLFWSDINDNKLNILLLFCNDINAPMRISLFGFAVIQVALSPQQQRAGLRTTTHRPTSRLLKRAPPTQTPKQILQTKPQTFQTRPSPFEIIPVFSCPGQLDN